MRESKNCAKIRLAMVAVAAAALLLTGCGGGGGGTPPDSDSTPDSSISASKPEFEDTPNADGVI